MRDEFILCLYKNTISILSFYILSIVLGSVYVFFSLTTLYLIMTFLKPSRNMIFPLLLIVSHHTLSYANHTIMTTIKKYRSDSELHKLLTLISFHLLDISCNKKFLSFHDKWRLGFYYCRFLNEIETTPLMHTELTKLEKSLNQFRINLNQTYFSYQTLKTKE